MCLSETLMGYLHTLGSKGEIIVIYSFYKLTCKTNAFFANAVIESHAIFA